MVWRSGGMASHGELLYQLHVAEAGLPGSIQEKNKNISLPPVKCWLCWRSMTVKYNNDMSWCHKTWLWHSASPDFLSSMNCAQAHLLSHRHYKQQTVEHISSEVVHPSTTPSHPTMGWNGRTARAQVVKESALERFHYVTFCRFVTVYAKLYSSYT